MASKEMINSCYVAINNIPHSYHSVDLRNFFSQMVESGCFDCFHFRHRPEKTERELDGIGSGNYKSKCQKNVNKTESSQTQIQLQLQGTCCCIIRLERHHFHELLKLYNNTNWLNKNGDCMSSLCQISEINVTNLTKNKNEPPPALVTTTTTSASECGSKYYQTRSEKQKIPENRIEFNESDLLKLPELCPPEMMPQGNIGTPTQTFLTYIQECRLPPKVIKKLGLIFPRTKPRKMFGSVPFDYGEDYDYGFGDDAITAELPSYNTHQITSSESLLINDNNQSGQSNLNESDISGSILQTDTAQSFAGDINSVDARNFKVTSNFADTRYSGETKNSADTRNLVGTGNSGETKNSAGTSMTSVIYSQSLTDSIHKQTLQPSPSTSTSVIDSLGKDYRALRKAKKAEKRRIRKLKQERIEEKMIHKDGNSEEDNDSCEEWERHEANYDDPSNQARNSERLFEEKIEQKWEKGGSGLVFYTDAQYWKKLEGDFDEQCADDWDVDMSCYYEEGAGDKDAKDLLEMRLEERRKDAVENTDRYTEGKFKKKRLKHFRNKQSSDSRIGQFENKQSNDSRIGQFENKQSNESRIGQFEKHTKGVGRKIMERQGWSDGRSLGTTANPGIVEALDNDGQHPKNKKGFGFYGEKLQRFTPVPKKVPKIAKNQHLITTVYDDPSVTDATEPLLRSNEPYNIKHTPGLSHIEFHKSSPI